MRPSFEATNIKHFKQSNPSSILRDLVSIDRIKFDPTSKLYTYKTNTTFNFNVNDSSRLLAKSHLSNGVAICDYISGDIENIVREMIKGVERSNSALIWLPTSKPNAALHTRRPDKKQVSVLNEIVGTKLKRSALETDYPELIPAFIWVASGNPYSQAWGELLE